MATKDKATFDQDGLEQHREITNTGGHLDRDPAERALREGPGRQTTGKGEGPEKAGLKTGDDAWHNRVNRGSEKGEGSRPMQGGNTPE